jgi:HAD superfamily hydrolase (TIGR01450 family)
MPDGGDLSRVQGFVFDIDGTLVRRESGGRARLLPGGNELLRAIRASGRPLLLFTNGSHVLAADFARGLRDDGLEVSDEEVLTPIESASYFLRRHQEYGPTLILASERVRDHMVSAGVESVPAERAKSVFVAHLEDVSLETVEKAAHAVADGAPLLTGSYARGYAGANGIIFSRGAMITAAIAKVTGARPRILGKPSRPAVKEVVERLGFSGQDLVMVGDDAGMDVALGRLGGWRTVLVRTGITGAIAVDRLPARQRPDEVIDGVDELLERL